MRALARRLALLCAVSSPTAAHAMSCDIRAVTGLVFGSYNVFNGSALDTAGAIVYRCDAVTGGDSLVLQLSRGSSPSFSPRHARSGNFVLEYNIYLDAARSTVWGDNTSGTSQHGPLQPENGVDTSVTVYGRIPSLQNARAGSYSDTVVVTIVF